MDAGHEEQEGEHGQLCEASMGLERITGNSIARRSTFSPSAFLLAWSFIRIRVAGPLSTRLKTTIMSTLHHSPSHPSLDLMSGAIPILVMMSFSGAGTWCNDISSYRDVFSGDYDFHPATSYLYDHYGLISRLTIFPLLFFHSYPPDRRIAIFFVILPSLMVYISCHVSILDISICIYCVSFKCVYSLCSRFLLVSSLVWRVCNALETSHIFSTYVLS